MEFSDEVMSSVLEDLHALGYDATADGTGFRVRLGFGYGVRVRRRGSRVRFHPYFGLASRTVAMWITSLIVVSLFLAEWHGGPGWVEGSAAVLLAVGIVANDVYRYVVTESAVVTIRYLLVSRY